MKSPPRIAIAGGGSAGWMTACLLANRWKALGIHVTLVEAPEIPTIGVGEGSTPSLKKFFELLGIAEADWMPACDATYKASIRFVGWSPASGCDDYSHPFTTQIDLHTEPAFINNCNNRRLGHDVPTRPDLFLLNGVLAKANLAPLAPANFPFRMEYGYHFDSAKLGAFLREHAVSLGVAHLSRRVVRCEHAENGDLTALVTDRDERVAADWFIDCSGFSAMLLRGALGVPFASFTDNLFNDAAVVLPTAMGNVIPVETVSTALSSGWAWSIPLTTRSGNGYVYSRDHLSPHGAEAELRNHLRLTDETVEARHLTFVPGQLVRHWERNCLAVGLAQGFVEPLEATALHLVLNSVDLFIDHLERGDFTARYRDAFNAVITNRVERVRDYIVAHYKLNTRDDSEFWRANRANQTLSAPLLQILDVWFRRGDLARTLAEMDGLSHFQSLSWHCLLAGYGAFPPLTAQPRDDVDFYRDHDVARFLTGCATNFPSHRVALKHGTPA